MSNPDWLLIDEEMETLANEGIEKYNSETMPILTDIAKAQLEKAEPLIRQDEKKKLVEWLKPCILAEIYSPEAGADIICIGQRDWQALLKEVGLED